MGESACLLRSFSHPSDASRELGEGDPIRALTESVSFGRFMSESLAWEKWSAFSHNRYLEEVEKFAKPGSVAQKKAYFEAHYRRKAALEEASNIEESSSDVNAEKNPTTESEPMETQDFIECDEQQKEDSLDTPTDVSVDVLMEESKPVNVDLTGSKSLEQGSENLARDNNSTQMRDSDESMDGRTSECETKQEAADVRDSSCGKKQVVSLSKSLNQSKTSELLLLRAKGVAASKQRNRKDSVPSREKLVVVEKKNKPASKSLHMSINFAASNVSTSKTHPPLLQQIRKLGDIKASLKFQRESPIPKELPTRASVTARPKISSTPKSEDRRKKTLMNNSVTARLTTEKSSNSLSKEFLRSKNSLAHISKGQSPIVCSPFRFRSDERAAKRKEKQEEKAKASEAAKAKPHERYLFPSLKAQPPKLGRNIQDICRQTKRRPPSQTSVNHKTANHVKGKSNSSARASVPSLRLKNNTHENTSPNIPC